MYYFTTLGFLICLDMLDMLFIKTLYLDISKTNIFARASSHGLVVKAEDSWLRGPGLKPPLWRPFFSSTIHLDQNLERKIAEKL